MGKKELIGEISEALVSYGYDVYVSGSGEYGFYTDGQRVISFGGSWAFCVNFSGNYKSDAPGQTGTGWQIVKDQGIPTKEEAEDYIRANAPSWAVGSARFTYETPEQHLATYGDSSNFAKFDENHLPINSERTVKP